MKFRVFYVITLVSLSLVFLLSGCVLPKQGRASMPAISTRYAHWQQTLTPSRSTILIPSPDQTPDPVHITTEAPTIIPVDQTTRIYLHPGLPARFLSELNSPVNSVTGNQHEADVQVMLGLTNVDLESFPSSNWVYALAAPFYTVTDGVSSAALSALWGGQIPDDLSITQILVTEESYAVMAELFGSAGENVVSIVTKEELEYLALSDQPFLTILPFEALNSHWKVLRIDGQSPIDDTFSLEDYPLTVQIWFEGQIDPQACSIPTTNYHPDKRTVLVMTGVTALTRATAHRMEIQGNTYPGRDIQHWLTSADLVHISNEVAFAENCPTPDPIQSDLIFCSSPDRIELLEFVSADIIELSGNHMLDYGVQPMNQTLDMYAERGWITFAGGWDLLDARSPAKITHNGNPLAFIGCNPVGPPNAWATDTQPGSAPCGDYQWLLDEIRVLSTQGYIPIVTLQYAEDYTAYPSAQMVVDFQRLADAGALIVNGSQAHTPKSMVFYEDSFLHFGLGNLFFDQMEVYYSGYLMQGTREGFIDRLVFYDGELISVELLTTMLEDYARPRPMTLTEREALLSHIFRIALDSYE